MKILFINPIYFDNNEDVKKLELLGGGGRYSFELARHIQMLGKDDVEILFFGKKNEEFMMEGLKVSVVPGKRFLPAFNAMLNPIPSSLDFFKKINEADVIHTMQILTEATCITSLYGKLTRKPVFITDNNFSGLSLTRLFPTEKFAKAVLAISKEDFDSWHAKNKLIIYGGVDATKFPYKKEKKKYVLYAGRILSHKGVDLLVRAVPKNLKLIVAGSALDKEYLSYLKKLARGKNVQFIENPTDKKLVSLYREASCFVLPATNIDYKGRKWKKAGLYALVVPEAMSCGTPVIVSSVGSLPDFIEHDRNGFVFQDRNVNDLKNKIETIMGNKKLLESMSKEGRKLVDTKYNWDVIAKKVRKIYQDFL